MKKTKSESNYNVLRITYGAVIAAIYVVLTVIFAPISFGPISDVTSWVKYSEVCCSNTAASYSGERASINCQMKFCAAT